MLRGGTRRKRRCGGGRERCSPQLQGISAKLAGIDNSDSCGKVENENVSEIGNEDGISSTRFVLPLDRRVDALLGISEQSRHPEYKGKRREADGDNDNNDSRNEEGEGEREREREGDEEGEFADMFAELDKELDEVDRLLDNI